MTTNYVFGDINRFAGGGSGSTKALTTSFGSVFDVAVDNSRGTAYIAESTKIWQVDINTGDIVQIQFGKTPIIPSGICTDASGGLFVADAVYQVVRQIQFPFIGDNIVRVAGSGNKTYGTIGNGGPAILALVNNPVKIAVDLSGNLYICERGNTYQIRIITKSTGRIAHMASSHSIFAIDMTMSNDRRVLYVAELYHIYAVELSTGVATNVAGLEDNSGYAGDGGPATSALLSFISGVAADSSGNLFISDSINHLIRYLDSYSNKIFTIAGKVGEYGLSGDGGPASSAYLRSPSRLAVDEVNGRLLITDKYYSAVRSVQLTATPNHTPTPDPVPNPNPNSISPSPTLKPSSSPSPIVITSPSPSISSADLPSPSSPSYYPIAYTPSLSPSPTFTPTALKNDITGTLAIVAIVVGGAGFLSAIIWGVVYFFCTPRAPTTTGLVIVPAAVVSSEPPLAVAYEVQGLPGMRGAPSHHHNVPQQTSAPAPPDAPGTRFDGIYPAAGVESSLNNPSQGGGGTGNGSGRKPKTPFSDYF